MPVPVLTRARASDGADILRLHAIATAADGHPSFGDAVRSDLDSHTSDSTGFLAREPAQGVHPDGTRSVAAVEGDAIGYIHVALSDTFAPRHWAIGFVVRPDRRDPLLTRALIDAAVAHVASQGGGRTILWVFAVEAGDDETATAASFAHDRDLLQMRVALPLSVSAPWPPGVAARDFEVDRDEQAWLAVNNRAFGNHPEQGQWVEATMQRRIAEPWFDPGLFLLAFDERGLAGFNWCRVHDPEGTDAPFGEIFVIGVDPRCQGTGLGKVLAVAGLERLASRGLRTAMLFVDAANAGAVALYERLGFEVHRRDRAYRREVAPA